MISIQQPFSLWMKQVRDHPWAALLIAGAAGILAASLWPRRAAVAGVTPRTVSQRLAEEMAEPVDYPGYRPVPEHFGQALH